MTTSLFRKDRTQRLPKSFNARSELGKGLNSQNMVSSGEKRRLDDHPSLLKSAGKQDMNAQLSEHCSRLWRGDDWMTIQVF